MASDAVVIFPVLCGFFSTSAPVNLSASPPKDFVQLGIVADSFEWPFMSSREVEIQTKVDHVAALTSPGDEAAGSPRWIRVHLRSTKPAQELKNVIAVIQRANLRGMKVLVNVVGHRDDFDAESDYKVDLAGTPLAAHRQVARFSMTSGGRSTLHFFKLKPFGFTHKLEDKEEGDEGKGRIDEVGTTQTDPTQKHWERNCNSKI